MTALLLEDDADAVGRFSRDGLALNATLPSVAGASPAMISSSVGLPQPDGPTTAKKSRRG
jgi:hypothetical protein